MPAGYNTFGDIGNQTAGYYSRRLLEHAMPVIILERYGQTKRMPKRNTKIIEFRRSKPFAPATTPLNEGVPPSGSDFGYDSVSTQIQQFGDWSGITDVVKDTSKDNVWDDIAERQGEQVGETREALTWDVLRAGTSVDYGGEIIDRASVDNTALLTEQAQRRIVAELDVQKGKMFTKVLRGSANYDTYAIEASYIAVCHTDMKPTIRDLGITNSAGNRGNNYFTPTSKYGRSMGVTHPREVGSHEECRYVCSPDLAPFRGAGDTSPNAGFKKTGSKYDVYPTLYMCRNAWGCIALRGKKAVEPKVQTVGKPRGGDPLGQTGTIGWKMWFACCILNQAWMRRLETACKL